MTPGALTLLILLPAWLAGCWIPPPRGVARVQRKCARSLAGHFFILAPAPEIGLARTRAPIEEAEVPRNRAYEIQRRSTWHTFPIDSFILSPAR